MIGLAVLILFALVAIFAPLLATRRADGDVSLQRDPLLAPVPQVPARHRQLRAFRPDPDDLGLTRLAVVGLLATAISM
jgi:hypothetical protein